MAIAYETSGKGTVASNTTLTYSGNGGSGSSRILFVCFTKHGCPGSGMTHSITYNGVSMTYLTRAKYAGCDAYIFVYYLVNPASGSNNIVITTSGGNSTIFSAYAVYNGVDTSNPIDAYATKEQSSATTIDCSVTVGVSDCWMISFPLTYNGDDIYITANRGVLTTARQIYSDGVAIGDSNGTIGTGSQSGGWTNTKTSPIQSHLTAMVNLSLRNGSTSVTVTQGTPPAITFSQPASTVSAIRNVTNTPSALSVAFSQPSPVVTGGANVTPSALSLSFSIPTINVLTPDANVTPNAQALTFSLPAPAVSGDANVPVATQVLTFSQPAPDVALGIDVAPSALSIAFSVPAPTVDVVQNVSHTPDTLSITFSQPSMAVGLGATAEVAFQSISFSQPTIGILAQRHTSYTPEALGLTFGLPAYIIRADFWQDKFAQPVAGFWNDKFDDAESNIWGDTY